MNAVMNWITNQPPILKTPVVTDMRIILQSKSHKRIIEYIRAHPQAKEKEIIIAIRVSRSTIRDVWSGGYLNRDRASGNGPMFYSLSDKGMME